MSKLITAAREAGIDVPALDGYQGPADDGKTLTAPADHPHGSYKAGDEVDPFDTTNAHLRILAASRTGSGRISAEAKRAQAELARRKSNRGPKQARKALVVAAVEDLNL